MEVGTQVREGVEPGALRGGGDGPGPAGQLGGGFRPSLTATQAQTWAADLIPLPDLPGITREERLLAWQQVTNDPTAWHTLDALSLGHFFVRRHDGAWTLVKVVSRIDGASAADTDEEVLDWATTAARIQAGVRILSWVPAPTTTSGFTTLHGAAVPR